MANLTIWLILVPLAGALLVTLLPQRLAWGAALVVTACSAAVAGMMWRAFDASASGLQFVAAMDWIPAIGAKLFLGVDGLSLLLVLLTALVVPFALLARPMDRGFCALMLFIQSALFGTFTAQNFVLWFLFYEASLLPAFLLIKIWGGNNRDRAATKFFVYTFLGSVAMLLAFLAIYLKTGTFDFPGFADIGKSGQLQGRLVWVVFAGVFLGLAVKVPLVPFHTWLPDAYASAPVGVSMVLTGLLSKMGVYGFLRLLLPLFPSEVRILGPWLLGLAVASILLASLAAWGQADLKRMIAYLSINHLGYCMLGLFAVTASGTRSSSDVHAALGGVFMQIFNHGITAAALFYYAGLLEQRRQQRGLADFGGLMQRVPLLCGWMSVAMFSSLGLPGLNGFIGEFLIFKGAFGLATIATSAAVFGLLITAVVFMRAMQALFSGPLSQSCAALPDLSAGEKCVAVPVTLLMIAIGVAPQFLFNIFNSTITNMAQLLR
jgi:NADH-quinone oxidoreductase subunit M